MYEAGISLYQAATPLTLGGHPQHFIAHPVDHQSVHTLVAIRDVGS
jgi:hypothetical protein